eukprot:3731372-Rhodomonas_salina.1
MGKGKTKRQWQANKRLSAGRCVYSLSGAEREEAQACGGSAPCELDSRHSTARPVSLSYAIRRRARYATPGTGLAIGSTSSRDCSRSSCSTSLPHTLTPSSSPPHTPPRTTP